MEPNPGESEMARPMTHVLVLRGAPLDFQGGSRKFLEKKNSPPWT